MPAIRHARLLSILIVVAILPGFIGFQTFAQPDSGQDTQIAYIGEDSNIWVAAMETNERTRVTTDGFQYFRNHVYWEYYADPAWSHDGTLLAFASPEHLSGRSIHYWDGEVVHSIPGTRGCVRPQFSPDSQRIYFSCDSYYLNIQESPKPGEPDPQPSLLSSVRLDGSDLRVEIPDILTDPNPILDPDFGHTFADIDPGTGNMLFSSRSFELEGLTVVSPAVEVLTDGVVLPKHSQGLLDISFNSQGNGVIAAWCSANCGFAPTEEPAHHVSEFDLQGEHVQHFPALDTQHPYFGVDTGPDSGELAVAFGSMEEVPTMVHHGTDGTLTQIGKGKYPALRPNITPRSVVATPKPVEVSTAFPTPEPTATQQQLPEIDLPVEELAVAYIGNDGNVWIADLTSQDKTQVTTDGFFSETATSNYNNPEWSPDGTMLTFHIHPWGNDESILWWDGEAVHAIPGTRNCVNPHFNPAGDRLLFSCPDSLDHQSPNPPDADADPRTAVVTSVKLDGTDMRAEIRYVIDGDTGVHWDPAGVRLKNAVLTDVDPVTGNMLVTGYEHGPYGWTIFAPDGTRVLDGLGAVTGKDGPFQEQFADDNQALLVRICDTNCRPGSRETTRKMVKVDPEGSVLAEYPALFGAVDILGYSGIPGTEFVIVSAQINSSTPPYLMLVSPTTSPVAFELGMHPAVQPIVEEPAS